MIKLSVVHFMPLEYYPPVTNFIKFLDRHKSIQAKIITSHNVKKRIPFSTSTSKIIRLPFATDSMSRVRKLWTYIWFNISTFILLVIQNPDIVFYYESYSAMPVYWYVKYIKNSVRLFIHNHEYFDKDWYKRGMITVKKYHEKEVNYLYKKAEWISQTNEHRLKFFGGDYPEIESSKLNILANYPLSEWGNSIDEDFDRTNQTKFIYVGSLSLKKTYIQEICQWIKGLSGRATLDIYSYNLDQETELYINSLDSKWINFHSQGIEYYDMPKVLPKYDIGLILYKGNSTNYKYNETNKLYEYLVCGLHVWFTQSLKGIVTNIGKPQSPKIHKLDFTNMDESKLTEFLKLSTGPKMDISSYSFEKEYVKLTDRFSS